MTDTLIPDALAFLTTLAANNSRDWFQAHKSDYEAKVKRPAEALLDEMSAVVARQTGATPTTKLYRIHRDLRFSKDKTPYNTHLHLQWTDPASGICHLFGASADYVCAGVGAMAFSKDALGVWRERIAGPAGEALAHEIDARLADEHRIDAPALKRVPAPYPQDHPRAALLKRKGIVLWHDFTEPERTAPRPAIEAAFARLGAFRAGLAELLTP